MVTHDRSEARFDHRPLPAFLALDVDPVMPMQRLCGGNTRVFVADVLILCRDEAVIAVMAFRNINDHVPFLHDAIASTFSGVLQSSNSMRHALGAMEDDLADCDR